MVIYNVKYEGSTDFLVEDYNLIKIEAKNVYKFKVVFTSRLS